MATGISCPPSGLGPMPDGVFVELHVGGAVAVVLQRQVACDGEQIRFERSTRFIETPRRTNQREKALLGHVLGDIRPPDEPIDEAEHGFVADIESAFGHHRHLFSIEYYRDKAAGIRVTLDKNEKPELPAIFWIRRGPRTAAGGAEQRRKALSIWRTREARLLKQASTPWATRIPSSRSFTESSRPLTPGEVGEFIWRQYP
jgi:hypothetical protein